MAIKDYIYHACVQRKWLKITISSGSESIKYANLNLVAFSHFLEIKIPQWLCPFKKIPDTDYFGKPSIVKLEREFGFSLFEDHFSIYYGAQDNTGCYLKKEDRKGWIIPWKNWDLESHELLDVNGDIYFVAKIVRKWINNVDRSAMRLIEDKRKTQPTQSFTFNDYDGELIFGKASLERMTSSKGMGWWSWLRFFSKPCIQSRIELEFDKEVGNEKGSWKGGIVAISRSINSSNDLKGELQKIVDNNGWTNFSLIGY